MKDRSKITIGYAPTRRDVFNPEDAIKYKKIILDRIKNSEYSYIINTTEGRKAIEDSKVLRGGALRYKVVYTTTLNAAFAACQSHAADDRNTVTSIQELHKRCK